MEQESEIKSKNWYDRHYKKLLIIPVVILILSLVYLGFFYSQHGDFILKDSSLAGGTTITINGEINSEDIESSLKSRFSDITIRKLTDIRTGKTIATVIETSANSEEIKSELEALLGYSLSYLLFIDYKRRYKSRYKKVSSQ